MSGAETAVDRVVAAALSRGVEIDVITYPKDTRTAIDAAQAVGVHVAHIVKSLVFNIDEQPVLALVSGINQLDTVKLSAAAGGGRVERADADQVRSATGFAIGGVAPFGARGDLPVFMDRSLHDHPTVYAAAGRPDTVFEISPSDLARASAAVVWNLAVDDD